MNNTMLKRDMNQKKLYLSGYYAELQVIEMEKKR